MLVLALLLLLALSCVTSAPPTHDDALLREAVLINLTSDHLDHITVAVHARVVTLSGVVGSAGERSEAQRDAELVEGVLGVRNDLRISPSH
jgi:osmotically-inducible protein OsmY